ncbi:hypothetical protein [Kribbella sp. NPDC004875]|uniref:hypothetical protein n=1 Tax=Kribbella sp. NPDC004875 TaxID=3364107 RepID=UPI0036AD5BC4
MRKIRFARVLASVAAIGLVAGACSGQSDEGSGGGSDTQFSYRLPDRFKAWLDDLNWLPELEKQSGVKVETIDGGPEDGYYQQLDLALSSGKMQDAVIANISQTEVYGEQGAFQDLAPLISKEAPNLQKYIDAHPKYKQLITAKDGKIYGLPAESPRISPVTFYRSDMLKAAGIATAPTTTAELTDALRALKKKYASTKNYFPLTGRDAFLRWAYAYDATFHSDESGTIHGIYDDKLGNTDLLAPGFKDMITWYHQLYAEGLVDPEWIAGANTEDSWQTKMLTGRGTVSDDFFTRPSWFLENGGPKNDPKYAIDVMPAFKTQTGAQGKVPANQQWNLNRVFAISSSAKNADAIMKFVDNLYSEKGETAMHFGVEGTSYKVVGGKPQYTLDFAVEGNKPAGTKAWNFLQDRLTFPAPVDNQAYYQWMDKKTKSFAGDYFNTSLTDTPVIKYDSDQLKKRTDLLAAVEPYVLAELTKFVNGKRPMSEWDQFVADAKAKGYQQLNDIENAAWSATSK